MADIYTSTGNLTSVLLPEFIKREALEPLQQTVVIANHVAQYDASGTNSKVFSIPTLPTLTAATVGETADLTSTAYTPTDITVTVGEVGLMTLLTDLGDMTSVQSGIAGKFAEQAGQAIGRKIDTDIGALFSALNGGTSVGTSGSAPTVAQFLNAIYNLELNNVNGSYVAILSPLQTSGLRQAAAASDKTTAAEFAARKASDGGFVDNIYGVDVYQTNQLATANGATGDFVGAMMGTGANSPIAMAVWSPIDSETDRDISRRALEVVATSKYAVGEQRDAAGIAIITS